MLYAPPLALLRRYSLVGMYLESLTSTLRWIRLTSRSLQLPLVNEMRQLTDLKNFHTKPLLTKRSTSVFLQSFKQPVCVLCKPFKEKLKNKCTIKSQINKESQTLHSFYHLFIQFVLHKSIHYVHLKIVW